MAFKDFREWISFLEREGELLRLDREVAPEPDVGAIGSPAHAGHDDPRTAIRLRRTAKLIIGS
jgi:3-polyprenyl-4-hydroxybenzoate decarboxylase